MKKTIDGFFGKAKVLKTRADGVLCMYHEIVQKAATDPNWDFGEMRMKELRRLKTNLDSQKMGTEFWQLWSLSPNFAAEAKKKFTTLDLSKHFDGFPNVTKGVVELELYVAKLRNAAACLS